MRYSITLLLVIFSLQYSWGQKVKPISHRLITIHKVDSSIKATVLLEHKKVKPKNLIHYHWYYNNAIHVNQGGYEGKLLDGVYQVISKEGKLIVKGNFQKGVKMGEWKRWDIQGELLTVVHWKSGYRDGVSKTFENGSLVNSCVYSKGKLNGLSKHYRNDTLVEKNHYKKGLLHGKQITYQNDTVASEENYRLGKELPLKEKKVKREKAKKEEKTVEKEEVPVVKKEETKKGDFWKKRKSAKNKVEEQSVKKVKGIEPVEQEKKKKKEKRKKKVDQQKDD